MSRLEKLRKLVELAGDDPLAFYGVGLEYINLQQWDEAVKAFAQAIAVDPNYSAAYYHKARAEISAGRTAEARATLEAGMQVARSAGDWHTEGEMRSLADTLK